MSESKTLRQGLWNTLFLGNGRNTVSRVLFRRRELTEFYGKLGEFCEKLGEFALARTNNRLRGTHWVRSPELSEPKKTHWVRCLKPLTLQPLLFWKKQGFFPQKSKGFPLRGTPKILGKGRKKTQKSKGNQKTKKSKEIEKSKDWRVRDRTPRNRIRPVSEFSWGKFTWNLRKVWITTAIVKLLRRSIFSTAGSFGEGPNLEEYVGACEGGRTLRKDVFLPSKHLLSAFYETLPSKNPSKNLVFTESPYKRLLRTLLLRSTCF